MVEHGAGAARRRHATPGAAEHATPKGRCRISISPRPRLEWPSHVGTRGQDPAYARTRAPCAWWFAPYPNGITGPTHEPSRRAGVVGGPLAPSSVAAPPSDSGICVGSLGTETGPGTTSGHGSVGVPSCSGSDRERWRRASCLCRSKQQFAFTAIVGLGSLRPLLRS